MVIVRRIQALRHLDTPAEQGQPRDKGSPDPIQAASMRRHAPQALPPPRRSQQAQAYPFPIPGGEPGVWGVHDGDEWFTRHCRKRELEKCKET